MGETSHTVGSCADDLHSLLSSGTLPLQAPVPTLICGHSFGGKVALAYLQQSMRLGRPLPSHTWILDSLPGTYNTSLDAMQKPDSSVTYVLGCVQSLYEKNPLDNFRSKDAVVQALMVPFYNNLLLVDMGLLCVYMLLNMYCRVVVYQMRWHSGWRPI